MELLAPAGTFAAFEAAVTEGADAVYLGAPDLNARAPARNFTFPEIGAMIRYAHKAGVKVYIAMNSLVKEAELPSAVECLAHFDAYEADAIILQDVGLLHLARTCFPNLKLHASTLMTVHNSVGVKMLVELGCTRIVLPREMTIGEIAEIFRKTGAELEVFVHGAMCFSYSGLCLFSSLHGGKSSLRGHCVQPCRRNYSWLRKKSRKGGRPAAGKGSGYLFSMNDLSAIELLPELARAGVASLKIEGRLKSAEYVRKTVRAYRLMLDNLGNTGSVLQKSQDAARQLLDEAMGRRRSTGFFLDQRPLEATTPHFSGNVGLMIGKVHKLETRSTAREGSAAVLTVSLRHPVRAGDRLRLHNEHTGERTSFTLHSLWAGPMKIQEGDAGQTVRMEIPQKIAGQSGKKFLGSLFKVDIGSGRQDEKKARNKVLGSVPHAIEPDRGRIGSVLKSIAASSLLSVDPTSLSPEKRHSDRRHTGTYPQWWIKVNIFRDMQFRLPMVPGKYILPISEENIVYAGKHAERYAGRVMWSLPAIIPEHRLQWYYDAASFLIERKYRYFLIGHFSQLEILREMSGNKGPLEVYGNYTVNALNSLTLGKMKMSGFAGTMFSIETDRENLAEALGSFHRHSHDFPIGLYVYGRPPLFTARLDDSHFEYGKRFISPRGEEYTLSRADEMTLARSTVPYSLLGEWKNITRSGIDFLVADLSSGNMKTNVSEIIALYGRKGESPPSMSGNYFTVLT